jgi:aspartate aminotransferase
MLSIRAKTAPVSPIRKLMPLVLEAEARGTEVLKLNIGQPDTESPSSYFQAIRDFNQKVVGYEPAYGNLELRKVWCRFFDINYSKKIEPAQMLITSGCSEALLIAIACTTDPGDEILVFEPTYANYIGLAGMLGVKVRGIITHFYEGYQIPEECEFPEKVKAIVVCNPNNPTGAVFDTKVLDNLVAKAKRKGIWVISDESYRELRFDGATPQTLLSENVIVVDSVSKRYGLCGSRVGCLISESDQIMKAAVAFASQRLAVSSLEQHAARLVIENSSLEHIQESALTFKSRMEAFFENMSLPFVRANGAFYAMLQIEGGAAQFAEFLLKEISGTTVCLTPAAGFYLNPQSGENEARVAFVLKEDHMRRASKIINEAHSKFLSRKP